MKWRVFCQAVYCSSDLKQDYEFNKALPDHVRPYVGGELKSPPYVSVSPDFFEIPITKKEKMLVLGKIFRSMLFPSFALISHFLILSFTASDGLWDELTNDECAKILDK